MSVKPGRTAAKILKIFGIVIIVLGILFAIIFCGVVGGIMKKKASDIRIELSQFQEQGALQCKGTVLQSSESKQGVTQTKIGYYIEMDGSYYETSYAVSNSRFEEGSEVLVYYNPDKPEECMVPDLFTETYEFISRIFILVGAIIGGVFVVIGNVMLIVGSVLKKKKNR